MHFAAPDAFTSGAAKYVNNILVESMNKGKDGYQFSSRVTASLKAIGLSVTHKSDY